MRLQSSFLSGQLTSFLLCWVIRSQEITSVWYTNTCTCKTGNKCVYYFKPKNGDGKGISGVLCSSVWRVSESSTWNIWHIFNKTVIASFPGCPLISSRLISCRVWSKQSTHFHIHTCTHTLTREHEHTLEMSPEKGFQRQHQNTVITKQRLFQESHVIFMCSAGFCCTSTKIHKDRWVKVKHPAEYLSFRSKDYWRCLLIQYVCLHEFFTASFHSQTSSHSACRFTELTPLTAPEMHFSTGSLQFNQATLFFLLYFQAMGDVLKG